MSRAPLLHSLLFVGKICWVPNTNDEPRRVLSIHGNGKTYKKIGVSLQTGVYPRNSIEKTALKSDLKLKEVTILGVGPFYFPLNPIISENHKS